MHSAKLAIAAAALGLWTFPAGAASIDPTAAMVNVGRTATACGLVASADYMAGSRASAFASPGTSATSAPGPR